MRLHVRTSGPREHASRGSVLFVHGFPFHGGMWDAQLDALPDGWRGLAPDLRGFGRTPMDGDGCVPTGKRMGSGIAHTHDPVLSMACHADDLAGLIREECGGSAVVCGLSMGGYVALELLRRHRDLLAGLVLVDTRAAADSDEARENRLSTAHSVRRVGTRPLATAMLPQLLAESTRATRPETADRVRTMIEDTPPETVVAALAGMAVRHDSIGDLAAVDLPTLVVVGQEDVLTPPDQARIMADLLPDGALTVVPSAGHLSPMENAAAFNQALSRFLERV